MIRFFDLLISLVGLILLAPFFVVIGLIIVAGSPGGVFYRQTRVGKDNRDFGLIKFRTMRPGSDKSGGLTIGARDPRITGVGHFLRKYKLDELPQLINVLTGEMSIVGPRPEIRKYVDLYSPDQRIVLTVKPGITDYASIEYMDENTLLGASPNPEQTYIDVVMPAKIRLNMQYINNQGLGEYGKILLLTLKKIVR